MSTFPARHIATSINQSATKVYAFVSNPENLPKWASGLGGTVNFVGGVWMVESPMGSVRIAFADTNPYGVLDHDVTLPSGEIFVNPLRVFPNGEGCEIVFTLFRQPGVEDEVYEADAATIALDLATLKTLLE